MSDRKPLDLPGSPMHERLRGGRRGFLLGAAALCVGAQAQQRAYPNRPIRVILPIAAGSSLDSRARNVCDILAERTGWNLVVDNRPGAAGNIGASAAARAMPDGHTLLNWNNTYAINPHVYPDAGYDALRDFAPIIGVSASALVCVVPARMAARNLKELAAFAREKPGELSFATSGIGSVPHLAVELFLRQAGVQMLHIPYKGDAQSVPEVLSGRVTTTFSGVPAVMPHIRAGRLRALAVSTHQRLSVLPDVPTFAEAGFAEAGFIAWTAFFAPAATPREVLQRLHKEILAAAATPRAAAFREASGAVAFSQPMDQFASFVRAEYEKYGRLVKELKLRVD